MTKKHGYKNSFSSVGGVPEYAVYLSKKDRRKLKLMKKKLPPIKIQKIMNLEKKSIYSGQEKMILTI